ncbi:MAG: polysaccharide pyruvyl transferase family protein [Fervidobacterium sp.]|uniref:polysaccharide pyruvyl transferase family protein n=1 Tax=Fervidobacterium sp. TaxID=1871331 RepID=UPI00404B10AA
MRLAIITSVGRHSVMNYGAVLQAFALQSFLTKRGYYCVIIDFNRTFPSPSLMKRLVRLANQKTLFSPSFMKRLVRLANRRFSRVFSIREKKRTKIIEQLTASRISRSEEFKNTEIVFTAQSYKSYEKLFADSLTLNNLFDVFIVGSDQVWNPKLSTRNTLKAYLLRFVKNRPKISYASSVASKIPEYLHDMYRESLSEFCKISVREKGSAEELKRVLGFEPDVVADPTILLTAEEWEKYTKKPETELNSEFIFVYDLYRSDDILPVVEEISNRTSVHYVNFDPKAIWEKRYKNLLFNYYTEGPAEFLWLIKNSKFVITSSFHGMVFSIIFKKPFYVILWDEEGKRKQNDRIVDLLSKLGLEDRCFEDPKIILERGLDENIDWENVHSKLAELRRYSSEWLLNAIEEAVKTGPKSNSFENVSRVKDCTGCFACYNVCPQNAIKMVLDKEGFYVPTVDNNLCTKCRLCVNVCPVVKLPKNENLKEPKTYVAWSLDDSVRFASSSGGIYTELAKKVIDEGGTVFAVAWSKDWLPVHVKIERTEDIRSTVGSKYIQSNVGKCYNEVVNLAKNGKKVLFVGTPCQIAGLKNVLSKSGLKENSDNILLVDLVCLGVSSSAVFRKYLDENFGLNNVQDIQFRNKDTGWEKSSFKLIKRDLTSVSSIFYKNPFGYGYGRKLYLRKSCYECPFSTLPRQGDITLGDFWGVPDEYKDQRGVSVVLANNEKGMAVINELVSVKRIFAEEVALETATKHNSRIVSGYMNIPEEREKILSEMHSKSWKYLERKYIKPPIGIRGVVRRGLRLAKRVVKNILKG